MNLLIFGGTGFLGKAFLRNLLSDNSFSSITIFTRSSSNFIDKSPELYQILSSRIEIDFINGDTEKFDTFPSDKRFTHVLHMAAESTNGYDLDITEKYQNIYISTLNILKFIKKQSISKFVYVSSGGVYGNFTKPVSENSKLDLSLVSKNESYSVFKLVSEHLVHIFCTENNLDYVIARAFSFYGQDLPLLNHFVIGNFLQDILSGNEISIHTKDDVVRSFMHQEDLARALLILLLNKNKFLTYNIGSDEEISIKDLARLMVNEFSPKTNIVFTHKIDKSPRPYYVPNIKKFRDEYSYKPRYNLLNGLKQTIKILRNEKE